MSQDKFTPLAEIGEFGLIKSIKDLTGAEAGEELLVGIGDDAAVYRIGNGKVHVMTTDALIEGTHFDRSFVPLVYLGYKAISVNASDIAAMNAKPLYATVTLGVPNYISAEMVKEIYAGIHQAGKAAGVTIIGGDTTSSGRLVLSVTMVGEAEESQITYRGGAQPGDILCVTGDVGASYAGLKLLLAEREQMKEMGADYKSSIEPDSWVIKRHLVPSARLDMTKAFAEAGVRPNAMIDVSDGLASEVIHLCKQSECGVMLNVAAIPVALETRSVADKFQQDVDTFALFGGEDYELLFAISEDDLAELDDKLFSVIGRFEAASHGILARSPEGDVVTLEGDGYDHFEEV